ncbi:MAG: SDR family NAD(P)-dependent oxidoreductase [Dokdonella sp.]
MSSTLPLVSAPITTRTADTLRERVVLVTGATGGVGRASALACARAGATVVLLGRNVRALEKLYDEIEALAAPKPAIYPMDLAGAAAKDYDDLAVAIERDCGRLHGVIHAASHFDTLQPLAQQTPEEWSRAQQVNVTAPFLLTRAVLPLLGERESAALVFVLDDPQRIGKSFWGGYGVSKHALAGLVAILHEETDNSSIRVHALLPGPMRTKFRRAAYFGEDTMMHPEPSVAGEAATYLLSDAAVALRGKTLDLRVLATTGETIAALH